MGIAANPGEQQGLMTTALQLGQEQSVFECGLKRRVNSVAFSEQNFLHSSRQFLQIPIWR